MRIIGLTGGIGCGKTTVSNVFASEGLPVLDCDLIAREVVEPGTTARDQIVKAFKDIVPDLELPDGSLNRKGLGKVVFEDAEKRKVLQSITGKAIFAKLFQKLAWHWLIGTPVVVVDAPTLYETKSLINICTEILVVAVKPETQLSRLMTRDQSTQADALNRIKAQMPIEEKVKLANVVIWNEGSKEDVTAAASAESARIRRDSKGLSMLFSGPGVALAASIVIFCLSKRLTPPFS